MTPRPPTPTTADDPGPVAIPGVEPVGAAPGLTGPVMMGQAWRDVSFVHWAVAPERVAPMLPPGVVPDVLGGATWVGLVPFRMVGAGVGRGPGVPWAGSFLETNVRLYTVDATGRRGIVFRSLDADRAVVVAGARAAFGLPYRWSRMSFGRRPAARPRADGPNADGAAVQTGSAVPSEVTAGDEVAYRLLGRGPSRHLASRVVLRVGEPLERTGDDDLPGFLTNRWGLHERHLGRTWYVPNEHAAWPLHAAEVVALEDGPETGLLAAAGFPELAGRAPDHVAHSPGVLTRFGLPGSAARPRRAAPAGSG